MHAAPVKCVLAGAKEIKERDNEEVSNHYALGSGQPALELAPSWMERIGKGELLFGCRVLVPPVGIEPFQGEFQVASTVETWV